jgi:hypothetical protein
MNKTQSSEQAMKRKLSECMSSLSKWCFNRASGNYNPETTMIMLAHKVVEMTDRIERAGMYNKNK